MLLNELERGGRGGQTRALRPRDAIKEGEDTQPWHVLSRSKRPSTAGPAFRRTKSYSTGNNNMVSAGHGGSWASAGPARSSTSPKVIQSVVGTSASQRKSLQRAWSDGRGQLWASARKTSPKLQVVETSMNSRGSLVCQSDETGAELLDSKSAQPDAWSIQADTRGSNDALRIHAAEVTIGRSSPALLFTPMVLQSAPVANTARRKKTATASFHIVTAQGESAEPEHAWEQPTLPPGVQTRHDPQTDAITMDADPHPTPSTRFSGAERHRAREMWMRELAASRLQEAAAGPPEREGSVSVLLRGRKHAPSFRSPRNLSPRARLGLLTKAISPAPRTLSLSAREPGAPQAAADGRPPLSPAARHAPPRRRDAAKTPGREEEEEEEEEGRTGAAAAAVRGWRPGDPRVEVPEKGEGGFRGRAAKRVASVVEAAGAGAGEALSMQGSANAVPRPWVREKLWEAGAEAWEELTGEGGGREQGGRTSLGFDADFESGNLARAAQVGEFEYDLYLRPDTNTKRHGQWFFFRISGMEAGVRYRLNIVNMQKSESLFTKGLRPVCLCVPPPPTKRAGARLAKAKEHKPPRWTPAGEDIQWSRSRKFADTGAYTLSMSLQALVGDTSPHQVFVAHSFPYTFADLQAHLKELETPERAAVATRKVLCRTEGGLECPLIEITNQGDTSSRKIVFICARVHPGETPSSWVMRGLLQHLSGPDPAASALRDRCLFLIVPMLNPDGVVHGNTRCSLAGHDLNRCWGAPKPRDAPILAAKQLLSGLVMAGRDVRLFLDLHAHSIKQDVFTYGCTDKEACDGKPFAALFPRVFPAMLHRSCRFFNLNYCKFHHQAGKDTCGRVVAFSELRIKAAYTIETSFFGGTPRRDEVAPSRSDDAGQAQRGMFYTEQDYEQVGRDVLAAMQDFFTPGAVLRVLRELSEQQRGVGSGKLGVSGAACAHAASSDTAQHGEATEQETTDGERDATQPSRLPFEAQSSAWKDAVQVEPVYAGKRLGENATSCAVPVAKPEDVSDDVEIGVDGQSK